MNQILAVRANAPSVTTWTRLEPSPRDASMQKSLQAQVRDPLWMLARQWQAGEFAGDDAGSPIHASIATQTRTITHYRPGWDPAATVPFDASIPLETHVEREDVVLFLRGATQLGLRFEAQVRARGIAQPDDVIAAFRQAYPIAPVASDATREDEAAARYRAIAAGRVVDGNALFAAAAIFATGGVPPPPFPARANDAGMPQLLRDFAAYRGGLFAAPAHDDAWQGRHLQYEFAVDSMTPDGATELVAPDFGGGRLDWYSFSLGAAPNTGPAVPGPAATTASWGFLPQHVTFRGMPEPRWWNFEDATIDFGQLDAQHVDLAKMLVMEFALVYGADWFIVPLPTDVGSLVHVDTLVVTDTFGERTLIRPTEETALSGTTRPWSMFKLSNATTRSDFVMVAPTLGVCEDGEPVERVVYFRDDMAAMAWGVEHDVQGELDRATDPYAAYLRRIAADPVPPPPPPPGGVKIAYTLETTVPDNWIPLVPVQTAAGELFLRRGTMEVPTSTGPLEITARAALLEPEHPYFLADRYLARTGREGTRYFRRTRWSDGSTFVWMARRLRPGRGQGWSGLAYDLVLPVKP